MFEASETVVTPARAATIADYEFADDLHQPYVNEFILGLRRQFPWQLSVDVAGIYRSYQDNWARVDINGIDTRRARTSPSAASASSIPTAASSSSSRTTRGAPSSTARWRSRVAKNMSHNFQLMAGVNKQWQHFGGTWNPTDPAKFIQPDAFASDTLLYMPRGNNEENSLPIATGTTVHTYGPTWQEYSMRFGGTYIAPWGVPLAGSYTILAGPWSAPIVDQLPVGDPQLAVFGPARTLANGTTQSNPLSTRMRFVRADCPSPATTECFTTRDEQIQAPGVKSLGVKLAKRFRLAGQRELEVAGNIFNLLNGGNYYQYNYSGANEKFNPNFLQMRNQQPARAFQATAVLRF